MAEPSGVAGRDPKIRSTPEALAGVAEKGDGRAVALVTGRRASARGSGVRANTRRAGEEGSQWTCELDPTLPFWGGEKLLRAEGLAQHDCSHIIQQHGCLRQVE